MGQLYDQSLRIISLQSFTVSVRRRYLTSQLPLVPQRSCPPASLLFVAICLLLRVSLINKLYTHCPQCCSLRDEQHCGDAQVPVHLPHTSAHLRVRNDRGMTSFRCAAGQASPHPKQGNQEDSKHPSQPSAERIMMHSCKLRIAN